MHHEMRTCMMSAFLSRDLWSGDCLTGPRKIFSCLDTALISVSDSFPKCTENQSTDISREFNYVLNIHQVLVLNMKVFQGQIFHLPCSSATLKYVQWFFFFQLFLSCTDVTDSKLSWIFLRQCAWTVWPLHTDWSHKYECFCFRSNV